MGEIIVGLDIGTTKVCTIVATVDENQKLNILGIGKSSSEGLTRGVVTNIDKTVASIRKAVEMAELQSGVKIRSVNVGIAGDHIKSFPSYGVITISSKGNEITKEDVTRLIEDTKNISLPADRKIIHVIPIEFIVDNQDGIVDPVGISGVRLEAKVHVITGLVTAIQNIYKCVERSSLEVNDLVLEPLASSYAVLDDEEKEVGVALLDIGGGTTDIAIFEERTIHHTAVLGIAGRKVTDDLRKGLGILGEQAEKLKRKYGYCSASEIVNDETITIPGIGGRKPIDITKSLLCQIIQPRMEEIFELCAMEIKKSGFSKHLSAGVVLTGGGSLIKGVERLASDMLGLPVKLGIPSGFSGGLVKEIENPIYSTGVGLVLHALKYREGKKSGFIKDQKIKIKGLGIGNIIERMKNWFDEL
jgi:cell division protein FtsA